MSKSGIKALKNQKEEPKINLDHSKNKTTNTQNDINRELMMFAVAAGDVKRVKNIMEKDDAIVNQKILLAQTPLDLAICKRKNKVIKALLESKVIDPNIKNDIGDSTPLIFAVVNNNPGAIEILLSDERVDPNIIEYRQGCTALLVAVILDRANIVRLLLSNQKVDPYIKALDEKLNDVPFMVAVGQNMVEVTKAFLESKRVDINLRNKMGLTALLNAVLFGFTNMVKEIINAGADPNLTAEYGRDECSALMMAVDKGFIDIVKILLACKNTDINLQDETGKTVIMIAVESNNFEIVTLLLSHPDIDLNIKGGLADHTALMEAVTNDRIDIVKLLLEDARIDPNIGGILFVGATPLMVSVKNNKKEIVELLLENSCVDVNIGDEDDGLTALMYAVKNNNVDMVRELIMCPNIDLDIKNNDGKTALDLAESKEMKRFFIKN